MADISEWIKDLDLSAVVLPNDKLRECEFFYSQLTSEIDRDKFRWLLGAFLNACYGYLEFKAAYLHYSFCNPETGEPVKDWKSLEILEKHVKVTQKKNGFVNTTALSELMRKLYTFRNRSTHDGGVEIMQVGSNLPNDFHIGMYVGKGSPALAFCREILSLLSELEIKLES